MREQSPNHRALEALGSVLLGTIGFTALVACTSFRHEVAEFQAGWRIATVTEVGRADDLKSSGLTDCRKGATNEQVANARFAVLSYRTVGARQHLHIVILDERTQVAVGDTVYANVEECGAPLQVRNAPTDWPTGLPKNLNNRH